MSLLLLLTLCISFVVICSTVQVPFEAGTPEQEYSFKWPIKRVAIIGAGPSGLLVYRELTQAGFDVKLFERDNVPGGNWHFTDEAPAGVSIPNANLLVADFEPSLPPPGEKLPYEEYYYGEESRTKRRDLRGPKPIWKSLTSNVPAPIIQFTELPWPRGTPWVLPHSKIQKYIRSFASFHGINSNDHNPSVAYNTRVEKVEKRYDESGAEAGWELTLKEIVQTGKNSSRARWTKEDFDAVAIATGRYNAPNVPDIQGLKSWADRFPTQISHSRQYRRPEAFANKTVLIVGAATSGGEISRDISAHAKTIYQSIRPGNSSFPSFPKNAFRLRLPQNVSVVPEIKKFYPPSSSIDVSELELSNGTVLRGIDSIIFATGYRYTFPFLPQYHNSSQITVQPILTDGTHLRALYLDLFYIEEPTLGFVDMNIGMQSLTYGEYVGAALAKVWARKASLPPTPELWRLQNERIKELGGYRRHFQYLGADGINKIITFFRGWLNAAAVKHGGRQLDGMNPENAQIMSLWISARFGGAVDRETPPNVTLSVGGSLRLPQAIALDDLTEEEKVEVFNGLYENDW